MELESWQIGGFTSEEEQNEGNSGYRFDAEGELKKCNIELDDILKELNHLRLYELKKKMCENRLEKLLEWMQECEFLAPTDGKDEFSFANNVGSIKLKYTKPNFWDEKKFDSEIEKRINEIKEFKRQKQDFLKNGELKMASNATIRKTIKFND